MLNFNWVEVYPGGIDVWLAGEVNESEIDNDLGAVAGDFDSGGR